MDKRKVLFTAGMSNDFMLVLTDAPKKEIEKFARYYNTCIEDGNGTIDRLGWFHQGKNEYYIKLLLESEMDRKDDLEAVGWDESYDLFDYTGGLNMHKYKLRIYKKTGTDKGNLDHEEFFQTEEEMMNRYKDLFDYNSFSLNPTMWVIKSNGEWSRIG